MRHGAEGYAIYWYCIELIANRTTPDNITFELKHDAETIGFYLKVDTLRVEKIMADMVELGLFENAGSRITCMKLAKRLDNTLSQNKEIKETLSNFNLLKADQIRSDKNRKDNKDNKDQDQSDSKRKRFIKPTIDECFDYCGDKTNAEAFWNFYESKGWMVGKNRMKSWPHALAGWMKRNQERRNEKSRQYNQPTKNQKLEASNRELCERAAQLEREAAEIDRGGVSETVDVITNALPATEL